MLLLPELQQAFADWVLRGASQDQVTVSVKPNGLTAEQRLSIYRNNTQLGLTEALRDGYPVVNKLVGTDFFNRMARDYIRQFPPKSGCLLFFGERFADFIQAYPPVSLLPYLPDVARLEWLWHEVFHEADGHAMTAYALKHIEPSQYANLNLQLHPSVRFLVSAFPVVAIWQDNQDDHLGDKAINLGEGGDRILIFRPFLDVLMVTLTAPEYRFLLALLHGLSLAQALTEALSADNTFDLFAALQRWFASGLFTGYTITNHKKEEISS